MATKRINSSDDKFDNDNVGHSNKKAKTRLDDSTDSNTSDCSGRTHNSPLVIKCKTVFKKRIVERALQREENRDSEDDRNGEPTVKYFIKYLVKKDLLSVKDVEVIVDEEEKCLRCSQCTYVTRNKWEKDKRTTTELTKMEWGIRNHIIGQHLGGFPCKLCEPVPVFHQSFSAHQKHQLEVHNEWRRELDAKLKSNGKCDNKKTGNETIDDSSSEEYYPDGQKRMKRQYKCSYDNCGKRFHKVTRWIRHEKNVHGSIKQ